MGDFSAISLRRNVVLTAMAHLPAMIVVVLATVHPAPPEHVYLFDCGGNVRHLVVDAPVGSSSIPVSAIDTTLPNRVRDGCAIHAGWYDVPTGNLVLRVQVRSGMDENDALPTKLLWLTPAPERASDQDQSAAALSRPDAQTIRAAVESVESPFVRSAGYVSPDGTTLLLQELATASATRHPPIALNFGWHAGTVELNPPNADATGRYALLDLTSGTQRGSVVSVTGAASDDRVVCITPGGRIYVATARDTLTVLDVAQPDRRISIGDLGLDLYWTACAAQ